MDRTHQGTLWAACLCLGVCAAMPGPAAARGRKKPPPLQPQVALSNTLNEKRDQIQQCAVDHALAVGAKQAEITTKVTINGRGQVVDSRTTVTVVGGDGEKVRTCVEDVIRKIKFPRSDAPLINIERTWTVASQ